MNAFDLLLPIISVYTFLCIFGNSLGLNKRKPKSGCNSLVDSNTHMQTLCDPKLSLCPVLCQFLHFSLPFFTASLIKLNHISNLTALGRKSWVLLI